MLSYPPLRPTPTRLDGPRDDVRQVKYWSDATHKTGRRYGERDRRVAHVPRGTDIHHVEMNGCIDALALRGFTKTRRSGELDAGQYNKAAVGRRGGP